MADNFLPNIKCPHCNSPLVVAVSGFGGELNTRQKVCNKCHREFFVHILVQTSTEKEISDGKINEYKRHIKFLNEQRKEALAIQLIKHEAAVALNREALAAAAEMRRKNNMN
ncbi:MAG: hypothetical protein KAR43_06395 [Deltaproteobacteria bacterium]|nr:hypothetical protein [Deltaproteobacteria bacterium]